MNLTTKQQMAYNNAIELINSQTSPDALSLMNLAKRESVRKKQYFLSGYAGVGKTFTTAKLINEIIQNHTVVVTAPTHQALGVIREMLADNGIHSVKTSTIHSFLNLKMKKNYQTGKEDLIVNKEKAPKTTDILFIDEASMIGVELFEHIENAIKQGHVKVVIYIGDEGQLLPIGEYNSSVFTNIHNKNILDEVLRCASDSDIINVATKLRTCISKDIYPKRKQLEDWLLNTKFNDVIVTKDEDYFLEYFIDNYQDTDRVCAFKNDTVNELNFILRTCIKGEDIDELCVGDKVIFQSAVTDDDDNPLYANGEEVVIQRINRLKEDFYNFEYFECMDYNSKGEPRYFKILTEDSQYKFDEMLYNLSVKAKNAQGKLKGEYWKQFFDLKDIFQTVKFNYACTAHKSQGSSYRYSYINMKEILDASRYNSNSFIYRLLYVSVTRAKERAIILL